MQQGADQQPVAADRGPHPEAVPRRLAGEMGGRGPTRSAALEDPGRAGVLAAAARAATATASPLTLTAEPNSSPAAPSRAASLAAWLQVVPVHSKTYAAPSIPRLPAVVEGGPDDEPGAVERQREAEVVERRRVAGGEGLRLGAGCPRVEDIDRPRQAPAFPAWFGAPTIKVSPLRARVSPNWSPVASAPASSPGAQAAAVAVEDVDLAAAAGERSAHGQPFVVDRGRSPELVARPAVARG